MENLDKSTGTTPADDRTSVKLVHDDRLMLCGQSLCNIFPGYPDRFSPVLFMHLSCCMFGIVH